MGKLLRFNVMYRRPIILERFDEVFDQYNDKKISKKQMLYHCMKLYNKLPSSWKMMGEKKKGNNT